MGLQVPSAAVSPELPPLPSHSPTELPGWPGSAPLACCVLKSGATGSVFRNKELEPGRGAGPAMCKPYGIRGPMWTGRSPKISVAGSGGRGLSSHPSEFYRPPVVLGFSSVPPITPTSLSVISSRQPLFCFPLLEPLVTSLGP